MIHDVFICHSPKDRSIAREVCAAVEAGGFKCWLAPRDIAPGESWVEAVERAIDRCRVFILIVSSSAVKSNAIAREAALALGKGKPVIHAYAEDVGPGADSINLLGRAHYVVDLWPEPVKGLPLVLRRVRDLVAGPPTAQAGDLGSDLAAGKRTEPGAGADAKRERESFGSGRVGGIDGGSESRGVDEIRDAEGLRRRAGSSGYSYGRRGVGGGGGEEEESIFRSRRVRPTSYSPPPPAQSASPQPAPPSAQARMKSEVASLRRPEKVKEGWVRRCLNRVFGPKPDNVDCSVFAPPSVARGENFLVQVFAHCPEQTAEARALAKEFDADAERRGYRSLEAKIARGTKLTFHLIMPGVEVYEPVRHLTWWGRPQSVQFGPHMPKDQRLGDIIGTVRLSVDGVPAGHIKFKLSVTAERKSGSPWKAAPAGDSARFYRKAFISYATQDRAEVLKRVQMLSKLRIEFFQDVLDLEPGVRWERELYRHIDESDLFLLFWSNAARRSEWVLEEVRYALRRKQGDDANPPEILPVIIEGPPPAEPPPELAHLHFDDYLVYLFRG